MVCKIEASDGSVHEIPGLQEISSQFIDNEITKTQINVVILEKIKAFCNIYASLTKKERKVFDTPMEFWNTDNKVIIDFVNIAPDLLIEMVKITHQYGMHPLTNLLCCAIARLLKMHNYADIVNLFAVDTSV